MFISRLLRLLFFFAASCTIAICVHAGDFADSLKGQGSPKRVDHYGYDWLDFDISPPHTNPPYSDFEHVRSFTNMNVIHSYEVLGSSICEDLKCAVHISAGTGAMSDKTRLDICPGMHCDQDCVTSGSYTKIWDIVSSLKSTHRPAAIYFIDEPFNVSALREEGQYVAYRYSSYICTLRQAMISVGIVPPIPIFTILSSAQADPTKNPAYVEELRTGMPNWSDCPATAINSRLDWIGIDEYSVRPATSILESYGALDPGLSFQWILVPPAHSDLFIGAANVDSALAEAMRPYYEILTQYSRAPVKAIMNFRYDVVVFESQKYPQARNTQQCVGDQIVGSPIADCY